MNNIIVLAKITPKHGCKDGILEISEDLIEATLTEKGNIDYELLLSADDNTLTFVEKWETLESLKKHMNSPHFQTFETECEEFMENMDIRIYNSSEIEL